MALFSALQRYTYNGTEQIACYQPGQVEDGYIVPTDLINATVPFQGTALTSATFGLTNIGGPWIGNVVEYTGLNAAAWVIPNDTTFNAPVGTLWQVEIIGNGTTAGRITLSASTGVAVIWPKAADAVTDCKITRAIGSTITIRKRGANNYFAAASDLTAT